ncbi:MAG: TlpA disulfide reductase family protein, partial [Bryobacteraceae bacterium]
MLLLAAACVLQAETPRRAPGFSLPDLKLQQHDLADYRGQVVFIDFMQTGCPTCRQLSTALEEVKAKFGEKVAIVSIVNPPENQATVARYISSANVTSTILFDCGQVTASYVKILPDNPVVHFPQLFLVDRDGFIRAQVAADSNPVEMESKTLIAQVEQLLQPVPKPAPSPKAK